MAGAKRLELHYRSDATRHTLSLVGELDISTAAQLQDAIARLCEDGAREIVLDLHRLEFLDSSGLRVILGGGRHCERYGCEFSLTRAQAPAQRLFEVSGVVGRLSVRGKALAHRLSRRHAPGARPALDRVVPDFEVSLDLNLDAPRSARHYMRDLLSHESAELRDAVMLLTSELVTPVVRWGSSAFLESGDLRVWLREDLVRVELRVPSELLAAAADGDGVQHDQRLLDQFADRWALESGSSATCAWFEVERHPLAGALGADPSACDAHIEDESKPRPRA